MPEETTETPPTETTPTETPPAETPPTETPAPVAVEVEPQKIPSFANWTQEEKDKLHERLERIEKAGDSGKKKEEPEPEPEPEPKPRKRGLRYKSRK